MFVEEVMSGDLVRCDAEASLDDVAGVLLGADVGSVVVFRGDVPAGIVTESDLIRAGHQSGSPFEAPRITEAMSNPLVTISGRKTLRAATERMATEGVKRLPVADGLDLVGIVTLTDVLSYFAELKREIHQIERRTFEDFDG